MSKILAAAIAKGPLDELDESLGLKGKLYKDKYKCLDTKHSDAELWWNSLTVDERIEVGSLAIHFHKMTANYKWCSGYFHWVKGDGSWGYISNGQKKIITFVLKQKDKPCRAFHLAGLLGY